MLEEIFQKQEELQNALGYDFQDMTYEARAAYIKEYSQHMMVEVSEMLKELPYFKPWKKYKEEDIGAGYGAAAEEWADVFHFFINVSLALGFDADILYEAYMEKNSINHKRQEDHENYKKCSGGISETWTV